MLNYNFYSIIIKDKSIFNMRKEKIQPKTKNELEDIINSEILENGIYCDLNHIDTSLITDMGSLFRDSRFNGNISQWDTSNVKFMYSMFNNSDFNGDISKWNTSKVEEMQRMFQNAEFNQDISNWDVSNVKEMFCIFDNSNFEQDVSNWTPYKINNITQIFEKEKENKPYWAFIEDKEERKFALDKNKLKNELHKDLAYNEGEIIKPKL